jgi:hypothetical protein
MPDLTLTCRACGISFCWTEKEQDAQELEIPPGSHHPKVCPEGLDQFCQNCAYEIYEVPEECKGCRVKQDGQRS